MLTAAAIVLAVTALAHAVFGELLIFRKLDASARYPRFLRSDVLAAQTIRATWHLASVLGAAYIPMLLRARDPVVLDAIAISLAVCGGIVLIVTRARHPGWIAFGIAAALVALA